jgi:hypothetical protein
VSDKKPKQKFPEITRRELIGTGLGIALGLGLSKVKPGSAEKTEQANLASQSGGDNSDRTPAVAIDRRGSLVNHPSSRKPFYEVVIIGSGYGASVLAARISPHVKSLAILERGKEFLPGNFPRTGADLLKAFRSSMNPLGLIDMNDTETMDVVCANGLGGTSLLNAAISVRPESNVFAQSEWPVEIQRAAEDGSLDQYFQKAESVLQPQARPEISQDSKSRIHQQMAAQKHKPVRLNNSWLKV